MGKVFLAEDLELERQVALKVLPSEVAGDRERIARFVQEAKAASALNHPNIITIHEVGIESGIRFIATEHIEGETLREKIRRGSLTIGSTLDISIQTSLALQTAHSRNIIHRDIKPENIMVRHDGLVKVLDFGLAKLTQQKPFDSDSRSPTREQVRSRSGTVLGTVAYMSPEQARGKKVDHRTDIFSLGSVIYEMLTGAKPFDGETSSDVIASILMREPERPRTLNPRIPERLEQITVKMLSKDREQRYLDIGGLLRDLESFRRDMDSAPAPRLDDLSVASAEAKTEVLITDGRDGNAGTNFIRAAASTHDTRSRFTEKLSSVIRSKFSAPFAIGLIGVGLMAWWLTSTGTTAAPNAQAVALYNSGTDAIRDGTYYKASKLLQDSIKVDENFPNAHARLAEAWVELDYVGRAEREMLKVRELQRLQTGTLSFLSRHEGDSYIDAVSATVLRNLPEAVRVYETLAAGDADNDKAYLDLGRALEKNEEIDRAIESYEKAVQLNDQYPAALLRLAILKSRKGEYEIAFAALDKAESIYDRASNDEGVAEVKFYRGVAFNAQDNLKSALEQFQQVANSPRANKYQKVRAMLQTSSLLCSQGKTEPAQSLASDAIDLAKEEGMENVATGGLIDLANSFLAREEYAPAEKHLRQALDFAHRDEGRRNEARAALALASLYLQMHKADEVLQFVNRALPFYEPGGYSHEVSQAYTLLGFASTIKGDLRQAIESFEKASQTGESAQRARAITGLGTVLTDQEQYPRALQYFEQSDKLYESMGNTYYTVFSKYNIGAAFAELGLLQEASKTIVDAEKILLEQKISQPNLHGKFVLLKTKVALAEGRYAEASEIAKRITVTDDPELEAEVFRVTALSQALANPRSSEAVRTALKALQIAKRSEEPKEINRSKLTLAEVYFITGNKKEAMTSALEAKDYLVGAGQRESAWRAWLVAAKSAEGEAGRQYLSSARQALSDLKDEWGETYFQTYSTRADIKVYLGQIADPN